MHTLKPSQNISLLSKPIYISVNISPSPSLYHKRRQSKSPSGAVAIHTI